MADRIGVVNKYLNLAGSVGRAALSSFYPNDFEYYLCAFELTDSNGEVLDYFTFPIQPSAIQKTEPTRTNIKKSLSGITVLRNSSFVPQEISIKGNFGKRFKILANLDGVAFSSGVDLGLKSSRSSLLSFKTPSFSGSIKTGYGAIKLLQSLLSRSNDLTSGKPNRLYFYNLGLGESYIVTVAPSGAIYSQSEDQNTIWSYAVNMVILSPLSEISSVVDIETSNRSILSKGIIQRGVSAVTNTINDFLK